MNPEDQQFAALLTGEPLPWEPEDDPEERTLRRLGGVPTAYEPAWLTHLRVTMPGLSGVVLFTMVLPRYWEGFWFLGLLLLIAWGLYHLRENQ